MSLSQKMLNEFILVRCNEHNVLINVNHIIDVKIGAKGHRIETTENVYYTDFPVELFTSRINNKYD